MSLFIIGLMVGVFFGLIVAALMQSARCASCQSEIAIDMQAKCDACEVATIKALHGKITTKET